MFINYSFKFSTGRKLGNRIKEIIVAGLSLMGTWSGIKLMSYRIEQLEKR